MVYNSVYSVNILRCIRNGCSLQIWVYGDSFKSMLVAVVVPNEENTKKWAQQSGCKGSFSDLCTLEQLKDYIVLELKATAERNKVSCVEIATLFFFLLLVVQLKSDIDRFLVESAEGI